MNITALALSLMLSPVSGSETLSNVDDSFSFDSIAEQIRCNIRNSIASIEGDVPSFDSSMYVDQDTSVSLLSVDNTCSDSISLSQYINYYTYSYDGTYWHASSTRYGQIQHSPGNTANSNLCTFASINIRGIIDSQTNLPSEYTLKIELGDLTSEPPEGYNGTPKEYYVYDYNSGQKYDDVFAENDKLPLYYNSNQNLNRFSVNSNGYVNLLIFHNTAYSTSEVLDSNLATGTFEEGYTQNLPYGNLPYQRMNVYIPSTGGATQYKPIFTIHGGTWWDNGYETNNYYVNYYREPFKSANETGTSYAHIDVQYRLNSSTEIVTCQDMLADINNAIGFIRGNYYSCLYEDDITLWGYSAGAHLAMMYAYGGYQAGSGVSYADKIKNVVSEAGPTYFTKNIINNTPITNFSSLMNALVGSNYSSYGNDAVIEEISPAKLLTDSNNESVRTIKSILVYKDGGDGLVNSQQYTEINSALAGKGMSKYSIDSDTDHEDCFSLPGAKFILGSSNGFDAKKTDGDGIDYLDLVESQLQ